MGVRKSGNVEKWKKLAITALAPFGGEDSDPE